MKNLLITLFLIASTATISISQNLLDSLILHYTFDGNANDYSGFGHHGIVHGAILTPDRNGFPNSAYYFDGIDDYMVLPNVAKLKPDLPITISFWIKAESLDYRDNGWIATENVFNNYLGIIVKSNPSTPGKLDVTYGDGTGAGPTHRRSKVSNSSFTIVNWHHIAVVVKGPLDIDIYRDCINAGGTYSGSGGNIAYTSADGEIGRIVGLSSNPQTRYYWGTMDDLAIWNRALSVSEIGQVCTNGIPIGINEISNLNDNLFLYPNPAETSLQVSIDQPIDEVFIYDSLGKLVGTHTYSGISKVEHLNVSELNNSIYFLMVRSNGNFYHGKLLKQF